MRSWKLVTNLNNSEGRREAMRFSYKKHVRAAEQGLIGGRDDSPHLMGLAGALSTRYMARQMPTHEVMVWAEVVPFMGMPEHEAVEMLAEYVVYQERPIDADVCRLKAKINDALRHTTDTELIVAAQLAVGWRVGWGELLDADVGETLMRERVPGDRDEDDEDWDE